LRFPPRGSSLKGEEVKRERGKRELWSVEEKTPLPFPPTSRSWEEKKKVRREGRNSLVEILFRR